VTTPRIRTWAESSTRWWLIVGEGPSECRFGPYKKAGQAKTTDEFLRRLAARDGWDEALKPGALDAFLAAPPSDRVGVADPTSERPAGRVGLDDATIVGAGFDPRVVPAEPWPVGCLT